MSKPSFTPGPWENEGEDHFADMPFIRIGKGRPICDVIPPIDLVDMDEESRANARLIAAAPELYDVAESAPVISKYHGSRGFDVEGFIVEYEEWMARRRAIMAKARGE